MALQANKDEHCEEVLQIVNGYAGTWQLLWQYDEDSLPVPTEQHKEIVNLLVDNV